ncbi:HAD-like protein [Piedraia hortae CBS 480.64]|uniref:HAD-like protein n=1 Tax=Piedraia hortae CBS 480.64 TaxID=1314780 RepID=A0A6A7BWB1_9PEZI|nr:HAD-like protein [Piedraia hortae CBS 480.64]
MSPKTPPAIKACLFDMDGLLINSEDIYTLCTNLVLAKYHRSPLPWSIKAQMQGRPASAASEILASWAQLPITIPETNALMRAYQYEHFPTCAPLPGVEDLLKNLLSANVEIALATSSQKENYERKTNHLGCLFGLFPEKQRILGDDKRIPPGRGKPYPEIYELALGMVNERREMEGKGVIEAAECLVLEDSVVGVEAGRRAGMQVLWCPHPGLYGEVGRDMDKILAGGMGEEKQAGEIGDGWGRYVPSLEEFPYKDYGIKVPGAGE